MREGHIKKTHARGPIHAAGKCRRAGLTEQDSDDVVQNVFVKVFKSIHTFRRSPPEMLFRKWFKTVTRSVLTDFVRRLQKTPDKAKPVPAAALSDFGMSVSPSDDKTIRPVRSNRNPTRWGVLGSARKRFAGASSSAPAHQTRGRRLHLGTPTPGRSRIGDELLCVKRRVGWRCGGRRGVGGRSRRRGVV